MTDRKKMPPRVREAATLILVRENNDDIEVYLLKRNIKSKFMGGLYVFPGGVVEPEDKEIETWLPHIDMNPDQIKEQLGGNNFPAENALGFGVAAIRETLEEAGVLIASHKNKQNFYDIASHRLNKNLPNSWFRTEIMNQNWILSFSSLGRWSHWITPEQMEKRFDTRFFIVFMPKGQTCVPDNQEVKDGTWLTPQKALEQNLTAQNPLSPPAVVTLTQLLAFKNVDELKNEITTRAWGDPIVPRLVPCSRGSVIIEPWDPKFDKKFDKKFEIDPAKLPQKLLPPGSFFSIIWCENGVWKPVDL
ncbi:MAG: hypothetical protein KAH09_00380 [Desulfobacula sp.]|nr:hypothetical protein [Desulfobacula sp.]